jgi:hypothetical protein
MDFRFGRIYTFLVRYQLGFKKTLPVGLQIFAKRFEFSKRFFA